MQADVDADTDANADTDTNAEMQAVVNADAYAIASTDTGSSSGTQFQTTWFHFPAYHGTLTVSTFLLLTRFSVPICSSSFSHSLRHHRTIASVGHFATQLCKQHTLNRKNLIF